MRAERLQPDVVVMDISMPELNGIDATRRLLARFPGIKVLGLSMNSDRRYVLAMFAAGAVGYLLKSSASEEESNKRPGRGKEPQGPSAP